MFAVTLTPEIIKTVVTYVVVLVLSVAVHEFGHALAAHRLGDGTPESEGRLTLNPIAHADPIGTLLLPVIAAVFHYPALGWGKPVPTHPRNYTRKVSMRTGLALVSLAGPAGNLVFAVVTLLIAAGLSLAGVLVPELVKLLHFVVSINVLLMVFNLLPVHPLDGGKILSALLPERFRAVDEFLEQYGGFVLLVLIIAGFRFGLLGRLLYPFQYVADLAFRTLVS